MIKPFAKKFPPELWLVILPWLRNPTPTPGSRPARTELYQPHLVVCMRVCKFFNSICEPLIYTNITVEIFHYFVNHIRWYPSAPGKRFNRTKTLRIEYRKIECDLTYEQICSLCEGDVATTWQMVGLDHEFFRIHLDKILKAKVEEYLQCLRGLRSLGMGIGDLLPNLETLVVDSIYAETDGKWEWYESHTPSPQARQVLSYCNLLFTRFINSDRLLHLCVRDSVAPLSLYYACLASDTNPKRCQTVHFARAQSRLPVTYGSAIRWVYDGPSDPDGIGFDTIADSIVTAAEHRQELAAGFEGSHWGKPTDADVADVHIFCSADQYDVHDFDVCALEPGFTPVDGPGHSDDSDTPISGAKERTIMATAEHLLQEAFRDKSGLDDVVRWSRADSAPPCMACGAGERVDERAGEAA